MAPDAYATRWPTGIVLAVLGILVTTPLWPRNDGTAYAGGVEDRSTNIQHSIDVAWLERIARSPAVAAELASRLRHSPRPWFVRRSAYLRLGSLATAASLAAVIRIETAMATRVTATPTLGADEEDSDGDGWTDAAELRLGLNPQRSDSDGDGLPDGADTCPLLRRHSMVDGRAAAIQRAFLARFGFGPQRQALRVTSEPVHVYGYGGLVLFGFTHPSARGLDARGAQYVSWGIAQSANDITVWISTWFGPRAGDSTQYMLKRFFDQWFVVGIRSYGIA